MSNLNAGPFVVRNGIASPISHDEYRRLTGRHATASAAPPRTPASAAPPRVPATAVLRDPPTPQFDSRKFSRDNVRAQLEHQGLPSDTAPRAAEPQPAHDPLVKLSSRARSRANMVAELRKLGLQPVQHP